jgi:hypothetical protein
MNTLNKVRACRIAAAALLLCAPIPFLVLFYQECKPDFLQRAQEELAFREQRLSATMLVAAVGVALGLALLLVSAVLKSRAGKGAS